MFEKKNIDTLPKHRPYDCTIDFEGSQLPFGLIHNLSHYKIATFHEYIDENLEKGFIWHSKSSVSAPTLFVKKKDGSLRIYVNYHGLNQFTIKNWYPLPLILGLLDQINRAKVYTKIDLHGAHNLVHIWKKDEWKTKFKTRYGHFEYVVMPFGTNALIIFQHLMNDVFCRYLDDFVVCYNVEIFIFLKNMVDHEYHVHVVLEKFREVGHNAKLEKCEFHQSKMGFLGYNIFGDGICMDPCKA